MLMIFIAFVPIWGN